MAAVLQPISGLSSPAEPSYSSTIQTSSKMETVKAIESQNFLTQQMVGILEMTGYDASAINTLVNRADSNTIEASNIPAENFLADRDSIALFLENNVLNAETLRKQNIYLNSNEPILLLGYAKDLDFEIQQIRDLKENVLVVLRDRGIKPVRVYVRETDIADATGLSFSLLNVVNSDIGVNMVSLLDAAFYGGGWKDSLIAKEAYNGYDLIWRDEAFASSKGLDEVEVEVEEIEVTQHEEAPAEELHEPVTEPEVEPPTIEPVRPVFSRYKSADDVPEDTDEEEVEEPVQHPALKALLEREAQKPGVRHPTWSRDHDSEAYLDIIKTHSGGQGESEPISVISRPSEEEKEDFEVVDKP